MQLVGKYKGPHTVHADISYPDTTHDTTTRSKTPDASLPWIIPVNPKVQQTPSFGLRIYTTFDDIPDPNAPGASFEMELVSAEVGIDSKPGLFKMNNKYRAT
jgi:hypothetical protein